MPINEIARQNTIHGFLFEQSFKIKIRQKIRHYLFIDMMETEIIILLLLILNFNRFINDCLSVSYKAVNTGKSNMPCRFGWHLYFEFDGEIIENMTIELSTTRAIQIDEGMIARGF